MRKVCLRSMVELARADERVVFIGSDITKRDLEEMAGEFPDRFFLEGIYEQHVVGLAAGMALGGKLPYVNTIASFLTARAFEQVRIDLGLHRANVRLIGSGGGTVYAPLGPTHLAVDDIALMTAIPNMTVLAPCDAVEMGKLMRATLSWEGPMYIRLAKGNDPIVTRENDPFAIGKPLRLRAGRDALFVTTGIATQAALAAAEALALDGIDAGVLHVHTLKPLDLDAILEAASSVRALVIAEEHIASGGLGGAIARGLLATPLPGGICAAHSCLPDAFIGTYGSQAEILAHYGLDSNGLAATARRLLTNDQ